ncbi:MULTISPECIES: tail assembly protein [Acinetobacter calcoaceticus/baumannii complex]|jgi:predicted phage tail protein|uniref:tail assembly protein n=1 Tax=Acinetobacter calcoaceticus/baumannii complex TaxID=909768 RepID=UPI000837C8B3|nr:tail assembly protein [Acinetobacter pittii]MDN8150546.1 tail assembly protein [Acinetobacter baumannii]KAI0681303.1 tail assembly protein [Acinetobacter pittii]MBA0120278.1 tail assembly protein [Acinetobacter pittii]MBA0129963.1 tail assembly protein [Acinetobacter pittii]MBA0133574.1 tail assembly protein [Acinetobacter pittii]
MLKTIKLYGVLGQQFGREFKLDVANTREAMRALSVQIAGFEKFMLHAHEQGLQFAVFLKSKNSNKKRGKKSPSIYDHETKRLITGDNIGEEQLDMNTEADVIHVVPRVVGAGGNNGILQTVLGAVLVVVGVLVTVGTLGGGAPLGAALIGSGIGMMLGGIAMMLMPKAENTQDQNQDGNKANKGFGGAVTTVAQGNPVPVLYGQREVGGFIVSAGQYPEDQL